MKKYLIRSCTFALLIILTGCSSSDDDTNNTGDDAPISRFIAGNSAYGAPGSWSENCLGENCARANEDGNYLLQAPVEDSAIMWSDIPHSDGSTTRLYSRYRLDDEITTTLVNLNPSTNAILDIWANANHGQTIDQCAQSDTCSAAFMASFTEEIEDTIIASLDAFLGDAWPAQRNPFADIYIASPEDALDEMHDTLQFVVTLTDFIVFNNNGEELTRTTLISLINGHSFEALALTTEVYEDARQYSPEAFPPNGITLSISISPSQPTTPPFTITVNASRSSSLTGDLTFQHDLTLANGLTESYTGDIVTADVTESGNHIWVVTATDENGAMRSQGFVINALVAEDEEPTFGGQGSCVTPPESLNANTYNVCQEPQNGSENQCDIISSSSITLSESPAPCGHQEQNNGALLGICTILVNEIRVFYYENPLRANNVETFEEKQARFSGYCQDNFEGDWSTSP